MKNTSDQLFYLPIKKSPIEGDEQILENNHKLCRKYKRLGYINKINYFNPLMILGSDPGLH
jgi:hypothetical protein